MTEVVLIVIVEVVIGKVYNFAFEALKIYFRIDHKKKQNPSTSERIIFMVRPATLLAPSSYF